MHDDIERVLLGEDRIRSALHDLAGRIVRDYEGRELTVVCVLKGSCIFASDLIRLLPIPLELSFVSASSYRDGVEAGELDVAVLPTGSEVRGRDLLLVDDILDTGRTLSALTRRLRELGAARVRTCVFLDKPARREVDLEADYCCFHIEDEFVVGYGLDYAGRYRNLPFVGTLRREVLGGAGEER